MFVRATPVHVDANVPAALEGNPSRPPRKDGRPKTVSANPWATHDTFAVATGMRSNVAASVEPWAPPAWYREATEEERVRADDLQAYVQAAVERAETELFTIPEIEATGATALMTKLRLWFGVRELPSGVYFRHQLELIVENWRNTDVPDKWHLVAPCLFLQPPANWPWYDALCAPADADPVTQTDLKDEIAPGCAHRGELLPAAWPLGRWAG